MSPETPNNRMDEAVRRYAQKRRGEHGDFSLHPATRRLLQGEVRRHFGQSSASSRWDSVVAWLRRWRSPTIAFGVLVMLATGLWVFSRPGAIERGKPAEYAKLPADQSAAERPMAGSAPIETREKAKARSLVAATKPAAPTPIASAPAPYAIRRESETLVVRTKAATPLMDAVAPQKQMASKEAEQSSLSPAGLPGDALANSAATYEFKSQAAQRQDVALSRQGPSGAAQPQQQKRFLAYDADAGNEQSPVLRKMADATQSAPVQMRSELLAENSVVQNSPAATQAKSAAVGSAQARVERETGLAANGPAPNQIQSFYNNQAQNVPPQPGPSPAEPVQQNLTPNSRQYAPERAADIATLNRGANQPVDAPFSGGGAVGGRRADRFGRDAQVNAATQDDSVLSDRFTVQMSGDALRIIDADGSVYEGQPIADTMATVRAGAAASSKDTLATAPAPAVATPIPGRAENRDKRDAERPSGQSFRMRAAGTNRTSGQLVVLEAEIPPLTATQSTFVVTAPASTSATRTLAGQFLPAAPSVPTTSPVQALKTGSTSQAATNSMLEGTLRVGAAQRAIRAIRVSP